MEKLKLGIVGCGDFLRCELEQIQASANIEVAALYDPERSRATKYADILGGKVTDSVEQLFADRDLAIVALFVPPWARKALFIEAASQGKHIITTKPLAPTIEDCQAIQEAAQNNHIRAAVIYGRTENAFIEAARDLFDDGRLGKLALYKQDWLHAHPKWNDWATDPARNGGPFMDAMIHNLNAACYLMDGKVLQSTFFSSKLAHPDMPCADTEAMIVEFDHGAVANLFITWAADLATYETEGNFREHIDLFYMITDKGWRLTQQTRDNTTCIVASREGKEEVIPCPPLAGTPFDAFCEYIESGNLHRTLVSLECAAGDIQLIRDSEQSK